MKGRFIQPTIARHFNPITMANTVMMTRSQHKGSFLLVEGDTDCRLLSNFVDISNCKIIPADGKTNVLAMLKELKKRHVIGILAIVDADFWIIEDICPESNVLLTDTHDIECMFLQSPALEKVIKEFLPGNKIEIIKNICDEVRKRLIDMGLPLGYLRWLAFRNQYDFNFGDLPFEEFVNESTLRIDIASLLRVIRLATSTRVRVSDSTIMAEIKNLGDISVDPWHVCQGHDLVKLLEFVLPKVLGNFCGHDIANKAKRKVRFEHLARELRVAYELQYFVKTQLYNEIRLWELSNVPYRIFCE